MAKQAKFYNKKVKPHKYTVGDLVLLSAANITTTWLSKKLDWKFHGPFHITNMVGKQVYWLELGECLRFIHDIFHVSLLKLYRQRAGDDVPEPEPIKVENQMEWEVEDVLNSQH